tara:strand:- start:18 stop:590 length:573 start_codon:yes stop_codon:yes gene_type:complete
MINAAERAVVTVDLIQARLAMMAIRRLETVVPMLVKWLDAVMECREMICDPMKRDLKPVTMGMKVTAIIAFVVVWWLAAVMVTPGWLVRNAMTVMIMSLMIAPMTVWFRPVETVGYLKALKLAMMAIGSIMMPAQRIVRWRFAAMASLEMISRWERQASKNVTTATTTTSMPAHQRASMPFAAMGSYGRI